MPTSLTATSRTLGEDLASKIVAAHIQEERTRLEHKIDEILASPHSTYREILGLTVFSPESKEKVYDLMNIKLDDTAKQELARQIILRSQALDRQLEGYIRGVYAVMKDGIKDATVPAHLAFAAEHDFLDQLVETGYPGVKVLKETGQDPATAKDSLRLVKELAVFGDADIQLDGVKLALEEQQRYPTAYVSSSLKRLAARVGTVIQYTKYKEPLGRSQYDYNDKNNLKTAGKTIISQARYFLDNQSLLHEYLQMVCSVLDSGKYPADYQIAQRNQQHFTDTITYLQLLDKVLIEVPADVKKTFFEFAGNTATANKESSDQHPFSNHFFMTLSLAHHLDHWEGGVRKGDGKEPAVTQIIQSLYRLEKKRGLSAIDRTLPTKYYRMAWSLPESSVSTYEKLLETGLSENVQFGLASMEPLHKLLQTSPAPIVEMLYATTITTLRESNWHYAIQMLHTATSASEKLLAIGQQGLKLLAGGKDEGGKQDGK